MTIKFEHHNQGTNIERYGIEFDGEFTVQFLTQTGTIWLYAKNGDTWNLVREI